MGWERRAGSSKLYYTRSRRSNGRVVRVYGGSGLAAILAAHADAAARAERVAQQAACQARQAELAALDAPVDQLCAVSDALVALALMVAGYQQHARGHWRKRRCPSI